MSSHSNDDFKSFDLLIHLKAQRLSGRSPQAFLYIYIYGRHFCSVELKIFHFTCLFSLSARFLDFKWKYWSANDDAFGEFCVILNQCQSLSTTFKSQKCHSREKLFFFHLFSSVLLIWHCEKALNNLI